MNHIFTDDIICAPATVPGTGAISVVRISGKGCIALCDRAVSLKTGRLADAAGYTLHYGTVFYGDEVLDDVVVSVFRAPHSYTGEDSVEISCHASKYIVSELLRLLVKEGCRLAAPGEFTRRAFLNGKMDLAQAEAVADVIASSSEVSHRVAMSQMKGGFSQELAQMRSELLELVTLMELELDFSEEDVEFADRGRLTALVDRTAKHIGRLRDSFRLGNALRNGVPVAIVGATNSGKSTLLNTLLGEDRAIVSDIEGTTRDTVEETLNIDGILFRFIDTAGLRESTDDIERIGIERSYKKLSEASIVLTMLDATKPSDVTVAELSGILGHIDFRQQELFVVLNKIDGISREETENKNVFIQNFIVSYADEKAYTLNGASATSGTSAASATSDTSSALNASDTSSASVSSASSDTSSASASSDTSSASAASAASDLPQSRRDSEEIRVLPISAKTGTGISELKSALADSQKDLLEDSSDRTLVTNLRHYQALAASAAALSRVRSGLDTSLPSDLLSEDLREALYHLGSIVGEVTSDEVLGEIFGRFCIGK